MSDERLTLPQIALLIAYAVGMSGGQVLFKMAAIRYGLADGTTTERILNLLYNLYFLSALALYAGLAILWVWISISLHFHGPIRLLRWHSRSHRCSRRCCSGKPCRCACLWESFWFCAVFF